ncbi:MAG TPA: hypothetical protein ENK05_10075 [Gammaproteobacteria bacterium]|nr:hypothetical protein [Gammaproteobacteria bacterium]
MNGDSDHGGILTRLARARARYAEEWGAGNARKFSTEGHYDWMAGFLPRQGKVIEIGVGNGNSTLALVRSGQAVIALDENPACLSAAAERLGAAGAAVASELRGNVRPSGRGYAISYAPPRSGFPEDGCLLLESDIMNDDALLEWVNGNGGVDAVVCWLMGTYQERTLNEAVAGTGVRSPAEYRLTVQEQVCRIAPRLLNPGGVVHFVDRCLLTPDTAGNRAGSAAWLEQCRCAYEKRAAMGGLSVLSLDFQTYTEPESDATPVVRLTRSLAGDDPDESDKAFVSVVLGTPA